MSCVETSLSGTYARYVKTIDFFDTLGVLKFLLITDKHQDFSCPLVSRSVFLSNLADGSCSAFDLSDINLLVFNPESFRQAYR